MAPMKKLKIREESQTDADNIGIRTLIVSDGTLTDNGDGSATVDTGGSGAPANATYITQTSNGSLSNEQALASLSTGIMKVTTTTGVVSSLGDPLPLANGGTAANLTDPNADRVLFWDDSAGAVTWLTAGSGLTITDTTITASGGAPSDAKYLTTASNGTLSAEVVIPGLAGSPDVSGVGGAGTSREFESGDTAPTWSSAPNSTDVGTTAASHLYVKNNDTTELRGLYAWVPAGALDARCKVSAISTDASTAGGAFGLLITDSDNSNRVLIEFEFQNGGQWVIACYTYAGSYTQRGSSFSVTGQNDHYLRITRDGSNNVSFWASSNGIAWQHLNTTAFTFTVANIGFRSTGDATGITHAYVDFLRTSV